MISMFWLEIQAVNKSKSNRNDYYKFFNLKPNA